MLAHQPAIWSVSGLYEHDGTHRALSGELMCVHCYSYNGLVLPVGILYLTSTCRQQTTKQNNRNNKQIDT